MTALAFGMHVEVAATVERLTARIAMADITEPVPGAVGLSVEGQVWVQTRTVDRKLQIVDAWTQGGGQWAVPDPFSWPGELVPGGGEPWKPGVFSLVRRFRNPGGGWSEPAPIDGIYLSSSWRTEGQRHPERQPRTFDDEYEPASFEQWRRVPVHWIALDSGGRPGRPTIVAALPDDVRRFA